MPGIVVSGYADRLGHADSMSALDVALAIAGVSAFVGGYRTGLLVRFCSWVGLGLGLVLVASNLGAIRRTVSAADDMPEVFAFGLVLFGGALAGKTVGYFTGRWVRHNLPGTTLARADRLGGAAVGVIGVLALFWVVRPLLALVPGWPSEITRDSFVGDAFAREFPHPPDVLRKARRNLSTGLLPQITDLVSRSLPSGPPPLTPPVDAVTITASRRGVVSIRTRACGVTVTGSGYVSARGEVTTAGHVVAGGSSIEVIDDDGRRRPATVAAFDPSLDRAVLSVDTGGLIVLPAGTAEVGDEVAVFGFPGGGALEVSGGGIRERVLASGRDIYDRRKVERTIIVLAADLAPGDSGAPVLTPDGTVVGMAIAIAPDRPDTAYAIDPRSPALGERPAPGSCLTD